MYYGVDFSGAKDAGRKVWIAALEEHPGGLLLQQLLPAKELPCGKAQRDAALAALTAFISQLSKEAIVGLDFPFCVPEKLMPTPKWVEFVASFGQRYTSHDTFKSELFSKANGRELRRLTDTESKTPFSPYNLRLHWQTFYGIRDVLGPLVKQKAARILPMQEQSLSQPSIVEVCPGSTLKCYGHYKRYKGSSDVARQAREELVRWLEYVNKPNITFLDGGHRDKTLHDTEGDALDSIIAATAAFRAGMNPLPARNRPEYQVEGYVYR
ncbi:MAG: DUF429 domain-containing protein [Chloroflexi bacterium]|nr:DUF429 domain-containing protein [Chloroflexota bacterium]